MTQRLNYTQIAPELLKPILDLEATLKESGLEPGLIHLVKMRASQINGCAYCVHMHSHEARADGEREERLYLLSTWRESNYFTPRERAALEWTEALTLIAQTQAPDAAFEPLKAEFSTDEIAKLTFVITTINAWNRLAVGFRFAHPRNWSAQ